MLDAVIAKPITRILIGVCTYRRPTMLTECLESLMQQITSNDIQAEIVVVDNERRPNNRGIVNSLRARSPLLLHYVHESRRGIAFARNRVLDMALRDKCDWIAFIDDDEVAEPDWIAALMAPEYRDVPILQGLQLWKFPVPTPFWITKRELKWESAATSSHAEGDLRKTAATNNLRISAAIPKAGIRFDETLGLMGGEDNEWAIRARLAGFEIRRTLRGIVTETAHRERCTYRGKMYRAYWNAASDIRRTAIVHGWLGAFIRKGIWVPIRMASGAIELALSPLFLPFGVDAFKRHALHGGKGIAKATGRAVAITGHLPQPYARVHGV